MEVKNRIMCDLPRPTSRVPVLGMILKGYPRISETFISNEILLLESLGFRVHLFSMRRPRENFSHESVKKIQAKVKSLEKHRVDRYNERHSGTLYRDRRAGELLGTAL